MNTDTAITRIIDNWDDWEAEAGQASQIEQDPHAGELVLRGKIRDVLDRLPAPATSPPPAAGEWSDKEQEAILKLATAQGLTEHQLLRQALRLYDHDWHRRQAGETCRWSGDAQRAREFAAAISCEPQDNIIQALSPAPAAVAGELPSGPGIIDKCPCCNKAFPWNAEQDRYCGTTELIAQVEDREITLHVCQCGATIAVSVSDDFYGECLYVPSTKEI